VSWPHFLKVSGWVKGLSLGWIAAGIADWMKLLGWEREGRTMGSLDCITIRSRHDKNGARDGGRHSACFWFWYRFNGCSDGPEAHDMVQPARRGRSHSSFQGIRQPQTRAPLDDGTTAHPRAGGISDDTRNDNKKDENEELATKHFDCIDRRD